jgi:hypothetical protein
MESSNRHQIRVNGLIINHIDVRHALVDGVPCGEWQIAIEDPIIGWMTLDDNDNLWDNDLPKFVLEVRANPWVSVMDMRDGNELPVLGWRQVTVAQLLSLLESTGVLVRETR